MASWHPDGSLLPCSSPPRERLGPPEPFPLPFAEFAKYRLERAEEALRELEEVVQMISAPAEPSRPGIFACNPDESGGLRDA